MSFEPRLIIPSFTKSEAEALLEFLQDNHGPADVTDILEKAIEVGTTQPPPYVTP